MSKLVGILSSREKDSIYLYSSDSLSKKKLAISSSEDGLHFKALSKGAFFITLSGLRERVVDCADFRFTAGKEYYYVTYKRLSKKHNTLVIARSEDLFFWKSIVELSEPTETTVILPPPADARTINLFFGEHNVRLATIADLQRVIIDEVPVMKPRDGHFDSGPLEVADVISRKDGIYLTYYTKTKFKRKEFYGVGLATLDKRHHNRVLWRSDSSLWQQPHDWQAGKIYPLGVGRLHDSELYYWSTKRGKVFATSCAPGAQIAEVEREERPLALDRLFQNPIITPKFKNRWESKATFNPAAVYDKGKVHVLYRAIGDDDVSSIGYASSEDGMHFNERHDEPCYSPNAEFEGVDMAQVGAPSGLFASGGGGWGGCEDPKITKLGDRFYMLYVAYNGQTYPRLAMTSIHEDDFHAHRWNWTDPVLISKPGVINKSGCLLPEKINGKYVIFHRIFPHIYYDYVDDLKIFDGENHFLQGMHTIPVRTSRWDGGKLSVGAPPIKTDVGWLVIYHATTGRQEWGGSDQRYKVGAMLLDLDDPSKVIARSRKPILEPDMNYENEGHKYGVVYPCGAVVKDDNLLVYYGGADTVVCAAKAKLSQFLERLMFNKEPQLEMVKV